MTQRVLVTGSTGYIGRHLVQRLLKTRDTTVFGFNRSNNHVLPPERFLAGDLLEADLRGWLAEIKPEVIFHAVGTDSKAPFKTHLNVHAEGTRRLLQALLDAGLRSKIIVIGSAAEYGLRDETVDEAAICLPAGEYGIAKLAQTQMAQLFAQRHDLPLTIARVFNVYGETEPYLVIAAMARQIAQIEAQFKTESPKTSEVRVHNLKSWRDFVHIDDVVDALLRLAEQTQHNGQIYNIASGHSTPVGTVLDILLELTRLTPDERQRLDVQIQGLQKEDISWADISKIRNATGWEPKISLEEGLKRELNYWRTQLPSAAAIS